MQILKRLQNQQGVTMIEVLVTISVIVLVLSLYTVNYQTANKRTQVILSAQKIVSDLRLAQSYAISAKRFNDVIANNVWGVYFDTQTPEQYIIFSDLNDNNTYDEGEQFRLLKLNHNIKINGFTFREVGDPVYYALDAPNLTITFLPPDPQTIFFANGQILPKEAVAVRVLDETNSAEKILSINFFGLIDVIQ
jgi:prepilin-type N-terminal cleavage/methylation domain-containing protein